MSNLVFTSKYFDIRNDRIELKMFMNKDIIFVDSISSVKKTLGAINIVSGNKKYILPISKDAEKALELILKLKSRTEAPTLSEEVVVKSTTRGKDHRWYKQSWGLLLAIILFFTVPYLLIPYLIYDFIATKLNFSLFEKEGKKLKLNTKYRKPILIGLGTLSILIVLSVISTNIRTTKTLENANALISQNKFEEAQSVLKENIVTSSPETAVNRLLSELGKLDESNIRNIVVNLPDEAVSTLNKTGKSVEPFSENQNINDAITVKVIENLPNRQKYIAEAKVEQEKRAQEIKAQIMEQNRQAIISDFSGLDGSYFPLNKVLKQNVVEYDHQSTTYVDNGDYFTIFTTFRGQNAFGGTVTNSVEAKVDVYTKQLEILDTYY